MGFFGMSKEGKAAKAAMDQINAKNQANAQQNWNRAGDQYDYANGLRPDVEQGYRGFMNEGFGDQGLQDLINTRNSAYSGIDDANSVADRLGRATSAAYTGNVGRNDAVVRQNQGDIMQAYGGVRDAFKKAGDRVATKMDFANGTSARSFAPAVAATMRRLRAGGISPNSPEGMAMLSKIDAARGHAFDDNMGANISEQNGLTMGAAQAGLDENNQIMDNRTQGMLRDNSYSDANYGRTNNDIMTRYGLQTDQANRIAGVAGQNYQDKVAARGRDLGVKQFGLQGLNSTMNGAYNQGNTEQQAGDSESGMAYQGYNNRYGQEKANAGWGMKMLGGIAGAALGAVNPVGFAGKFATGLGKNIFGGQ